MGSINDWLAGRVHVHSALTETRGAIAMPMPTAMIAVA
jgi:hypothetical protein